MHRLPVGDWSILTLLHGAGGQLGPHFLERGGGEAGGTVKLRVFRPTPTPGKLTIVAESAYETVGPGISASFPVRIAVQPGDVLGLETGSSPDSYPTVVAGASGDLESGVSGGPALGQTVGPGGEYSYFTNSERLANIAATLTSATETLRVAKSGAGAGTVTSLPAGIDCGSSCSASFALDSALSLSATASPGSVFAGWSGGGCSGTGACQLSLLDDTEVFADFIPSNIFALAKPKLNKATGTATLLVDHPWSRPASPRGKGAEEADQDRRRRRQSEALHQAFAQDPQKTAEDG